MCCRGIGFGESGFFIQVLTSWLTQIRTKTLERGNNNTDHRNSELLAQVSSLRVISWTIIAIGEQRRSLFDSSTWGTIPWHLLTFAVKPDYENLSRICNTSHRTIFFREQLFRTNKTLAVYLKSQQNCRIHFSKMYSAILLALASIETPVRTYSK